MSGHSQQRVAELLGVSQPAVHGWLDGTSRPKPHLREALHALTGIEPTAWELKEEQEQLGAALDLIARRASS
jgi:predicted transcriptional regulator